MNTTTAQTKIRTGVLLDLREKAAARRSARAARGALQRDLMTYRTPAEVNDLLGAMVEQEGPEVDEMRRTLLSNIRGATSTPLAS